MNLAAFDDPAFLAHVAVALRTHREAIRQTRSHVPPAVADLENYCATRVHKVQGGSNLTAQLETAHDDHMTPPLLHPLTEVARLLGGISDATVKRLTGTGHLPTVKIRGRTFVHRDDLHRYIDQLRETA